MSDRYPPVRLYREFDGDRYLTIRDSVNISFYARASHQDIRHAVIRALDAYRRAIGHQRLAWYVDQHGEWQELDDSGWSFIRENVLDPEGSRVILSESPSATTGYEFEYRGRNLDSPICANDPDIVSGVSFWLPTEFIEEHGPNRVRELALELGAELPFNSGHAGLCFQAPLDLLGITQAIRKVCFDYPGMEFPSLSDTTMSIGTRVRTVQWLNFLGQPVLGELGGTSGLRSRLHAPETTVQELEGDRAVVTLGQWPEMGTTEPERTLAPYRELARVLEPWLVLGRGAQSGFTEEDMHRWERRFLDD